MTTVEALRLALEQEIKAIEIYSKLALEHQAVKETMDFLITEEQKHKKLLEKKIVEATRG